MVHEGRQDDGHDDWREQLALDLYGELEAHERAALAEHLGSCGGCRAFAVELRGGLGALSATERGDPMLASLRSSVAAAVGRSESSARRVRPFWLGLALGLGGGLAAAWLVVTLAPRAAPAGGETAPTEASAWGRATPPPLAPAGGEIARLGAYLRR